MENKESPFFLNNQIAADMVSTLHAAANVIKKSPGSIPNTNLPFYPYVSSATLYSNQHNRPQISTNSTQMVPSSVATPFGINDILNRTAAAGACVRNFNGNKMINNFKFNRAPNFANTMATMGNNQGIRRTATAVAAHAAVMLFNNNYENGFHDNQLGQMKFAGKPLTDMSGRPPIYWPGVLTEDWHEKVGMQG